MFPMSARFVRALPPSPAPQQARRSSPGDPDHLRRRPGFARAVAAQAEHRRAIAEFGARRAADQQARRDALLLEAIAALASLLGAPGPHPSPAARPAPLASDCHQDLPEPEHRMLPTHVQTPWPLTPSMRRRWPPSKPAGSGQPLAAFALVRGWSGAIFFPGSGSSSGVRTRGGEAGGFTDPRRNSPDLFSELFARAWAVPRQRFPTTFSGPRALLLGIVIPLPNRLQPGNGKGQISGH